MLMAYLVINMIGSIYTVFVKRKEVDEGVKEHITPDGFKNRIGYLVGYWSSIIIALVIFAFIWAPAKLVASIKN
jgi:dolichyl-phosphate-mannose--protein O-mannosyl transferase